MFAKVVYAIWILIPCIYLFLGVWGKVEQLTKSSIKQNPNDFFRQGAFVTICVAIAFAVDKHLLQDFIDITLQGFLPLELAQVLLLPLIFVIAASIWGPTKKQRISAAPRVSERKKDE